MNEIKFKDTLEFDSDGLKLKGELIVPDKAKGIVIFSHGSGSSRFSPRNNYVAKLLNEKKFATLLADLLTPEEDLILKNRFDINLLTGRLIQITKNISEMEITEELNIGYFGASTGAASALNSAALLGPDYIKAVVSRGGRPDLSMPVLNKVKSPVLLIVGGLDTEVIELNRQAFIRLDTVKKMEIVPGSSHLFEEPGKLEIVAKLAIGWYSKYLTIGKEILK